MTEITASMVKELREKTGAGMMDCKAALTEAKNMEGAIKMLREKGLAKALKKTKRVATEGLISIAKNDGCAAMVELNCETDFVARNEDFKTLVNELANTALSFDAQTNDETSIDGSLLISSKMPSSQTVEAMIAEKIAKIGEKIDLRRFAVLRKGDLYGTYVHGGGSIGVVVECTLNQKDLATNEEVLTAARDLAMHVAASSPSFIDKKGIPSSWVESERDIFRTQVLASGKPKEMVDKIVDGKMEKHEKDFCLLEQPFVKNPDISVATMLKELHTKTGALLTVKRMVRFKVGEGLVKKDDDFAEEVKKMTA